MKKKELKALAKRIADAELIIQNSSDSKEISKAQNTIMELTSKVHGVEDLMTIDELVQEILNQKT